ncbi:hypothetical protein ID866_12600 [Astraeus odoratus]|nr:hypothetical protein ID866_12600 [Astraeus odoratus]
MSMHKSSMVMGTLAEKSINWTKVPDEELATDINDMDSVEEAEKCQKEEEERHQREAEAEQKQKNKERKRVAAAEARKQQWADSEAQASRSWMNMFVGQEMFSVVMMSPQGREHKKQAKKLADNDDDDEIVILSSQKTK